MNKRVMVLIIFVLPAMFLIMAIVAQASAGEQPTIRKLSSGTVPWAQHDLVICDSPNQLVFGHAVPDGETWTLTSIHAKNNSGHTVEINVAIYSASIDEWICLGGVAGAGWYQGVSWSGAIEMSARDQLGWWFRGANPGDILQVDATFTRHLATGAARQLRMLSIPANETLYLR